MSKLIESIKIKAKLLQKLKHKTDPKFKLKNAYELLAKTAGYSSWRNWKEILNDHQDFAPPGSAYWHVWYSSYEQAIDHLNQTKNTFLIPYQKHFFICDEHYIRFLGLEILSSEIQAAGRNWAHPNSSRSLETIKNTIKLKNKRV